MRFYEITNKSVEHFAILGSYLKINQNETCVNPGTHIYHKATAHLHQDNLVSDQSLIERGVRQGNSSHSYPALQQMKQSSIKGTSNIF